MTACGFKNNEVTWAHLLLFKKKKKGLWSPTADVVRKFLVFSLNRLLPNYQHFLPFFLLLPDRQVGNTGHFFLSHRHSNWICWAEPVDIAVLLFFFVSVEKWWSRSVSFPGDDTISSNAVFWSIMIFCFLLLVISSKVLCWCDWPAGRCVVPAASSKREQQPNRFFAKKKKRLKRSRTIPLSEEEKKISTFLRFGNVVEWTLLLSWTPFFNIRHRE